jgi:hypothetical protein
MRAIVKFASVAAFVLAAPAFAAQPDVKDKLVVEGAVVVALKDGGNITLGKDGKTYHVDAAGKRVRMKDGVVMEGKDGRKYLHKNDVIWQQIAEKGTLAPNR